MCLQDARPFSGNRTQRSSVEDFEEGLIDDCGFWILDLAAQTSTASQVVTNRHHFPEHMHILEPANLN
jgi:hypothetical protein